MSPTTRALGLRLQPCFRKSSPGLWFPWSIHRLSTVSSMSSTFAQPEGLARVPVGFGDSFSAVSPQQVTGRSLAYDYYLTNSDPLTTSRCPHYPRVVGLGHFQVPPWKGFRLFTMPDSNRHLIPYVGITLPIELIVGDCRSAFHVAQYLWSTKYHTPTFPNPPRFVWNSPGSADMPTRTAVSWVLLSIGDLELTPCSVPVTACLEDSLCRVRG